MVMPEDTDTDPALIQREFTRQADRAQALRESSSAQRASKLKRFKEALVLRSESLYEAFRLDL